jgi:hypothetical protein
MGIKFTGGDPARKDHQPWSSCLGHVVDDLLNDFPNKILKRWQEDVGCWAPKRIGFCWFIIVQ